MHWFFNAFYILQRLDPKSVINTMKSVITLSHGPEVYCVLTICIWLITSSKTGTK